MRRDFQNDIIGAEDLQREKSVYGIDEAFFLEVPRKEHGKPEIVNTNKKMENLRTYKTQLQTNGNYHYNNTITLLYYTLITYTYF